MAEVQANRVAVMPSPGSNPGGRGGDPVAAQEKEVRLLLDEIGCGRLDRFDVFVDRYRDRLIGFIRARVGDQQWAEDLVQEVFLRVFRAARDGKHATRAGSVNAWVFRIAINCAKDHQRQGRRKPLRLDGDLAGEGNEAGAAAAAAAGGAPEPLESMLQSEEEVTVEALVRQLPEKQCLVVIMKFWSDMTFVEIAEAVGCSEATVKSRMRYGLIKLDRMLRKHGVYQGSSADDI